METRFDLVDDRCQEPGCSGALQEVPGEAIAYCPRGHCWMLFDDPAGLLTGSRGAKLMQRRQLDLDLQRPLS